MEEDGNKQLELKDFEDENRLYLVVNDGSKNILIESKNVKFMKDEETAFGFLENIGYKFKCHKNGSRTYWEVMNKKLGYREILKVNEIIDFANNILIDEKIKNDVEDYGIDVKTRDLINWCFGNNMRLRTNNISYRDVVEEIRNESAMRRMMESRR